MLQYIFSYLIILKSLLKYDKILLEKKEGLYEKKDTKNSRLGNVSINGWFCYCWGSSLFYRESVIASIKVLNLSIKSKTINNEEAKNGPYGTSLFFLRKK